MQRRKLSDWAEDYLWELRQKRGPDGFGTWRNEASRVRRLAEWYDKSHRAPSSFDAVSARGYLFGVRETGWPGAACSLGNGAFNNCLLYIKAFSRWLEEQGVIKSAARICAIENKKPTQSEKHRIDRTQMRQMLSNATDPWERWLIVVALETAGRVSELQPLKWRHIRSSDRTLRWYRPKTRQYDNLPAMPLLLREAIAWRTHLTGLGIELGEDDHLIPARRWVGGQGGKWRYYPQLTASYQSIHLVIKRHLNQFFTMEELENEACHVLRRSAARELYEVFKEMAVPDPMRKVQAWLGHSSITQTEVYIGVRRDREERNELMDGLDWLAVSDENVVDLEARRGHG